MVLGVTSSATRPAGGAELAFVALLRRLQEDHGFRSVLCGTGARRWSGRLHGIEATTVRDAEDLRVLIHDLQPDVVISTQLAPDRCQRLTAFLGVPHVVFCQSFEFCPPTPRERSAWGVSLDREYPSAEARRLVARADAVVANSSFLQQRLKRFGIGSQIMCPEFEADDLRGSSTRARQARYVTGICGHPHKGADIFLELAARLPHVPFLLPGHLSVDVARRLSALPNIRHMPFGPPSRFLNRSRIVLVPSRWPEPFGRIAVEAMARGIPALASGVGGLTEIVGAASPLVVGRHRDVDQWEQRLRELLEEPATAKRNAAEGVRRAARFLSGRSAREMAALLRRLMRTARHGGVRPARSIVLAGDSRRATAFSMVNRAWASEAASRVDAGTVLVRPIGKHDVPADVTVCNDFTERFTEWPTPPEGHLVAVRTWDFGPFPKAWVDRLVSYYDQLWVHTRWVREQAIAGGVPPGRVHVVPLGIDPYVFHPRGPRYPLRTRKRFRFLFVGAPIVRKGVDVLLDSYCASFTSADDVCLVLKVNPRDVFYEGVDLRAQIAAVMNRPGAPEIELVDEFITPRQLASLYRACSTAVFPYRAEGFAMPILESMACGCPAIVPRFGACLDYCSDADSWLIPVRRIQVPVLRRMAINSLGFEEDIDAVDFCEVERQTLEGVLRAVASGPEPERAAKAAAAAKAARDFTWVRSFDAVMRALDALDRRRAPVRIAASRAAVLRDEARRAAARELLAAALNGSA